jgi:hypothetical protein
MGRSQYNERAANVPFASTQAVRFGERAKAAARNEQSRGEIVRIGLFPVAT